jgi:polyphosphate kinase
MQADGTYIQRTVEPGGERRCAQEVLIEKSEKRLAEAKRLYKKQFSKKIPKRKKK